MILMGITPNGTGMFRHKKLKKQTKLTKIRKHARGVAYSSKICKYYKTDYWKKLKKVLLPHVCFLCNEPAITLHHISYDKLGYEQWLDLIPVCSNCHSRIHRKLQESYPKLPVRHAVKSTGKIWPELANGDSLKSIREKYDWKNYFYKALHRMGDKLKPKKIEYHYTKEKLQPRCKKCDRYAPGIALNGSGLCRHCS